MTAERNAHLIQLWLDNEEPSYLYVRELAQNADSQYELGESLRQFVEAVCAANCGHDDSEYWPEGIAGDLLSAAIGSVDWYEMAGRYLERENE